MHPLVQALAEATPEHLRPFVPRGFYIDKAIKNLIATYLTNGGFTRKEQQDYDDLTMQRSSLMVPRLPRRRRGLCDRLQRRLNSFS